MRGLVQMGTEVGIKIENNFTKETDYSKAF